MEKSNISWTHNTWNPWVGCDKVAPECQHCYIDRELRKQRDWLTKQKRLSWGELYTTLTWNDPYKWQRALEGTGMQKRIFACSLSDFFHAKADKRILGTDWAKKMGGHFKDWGELLWRDGAWRVIRETPNLSYLILTKRPELIMKRLPKDWGYGYPNVWIGTSVGTKQTLSRVDSLRKIPVHPRAVRFLSCEPLLENIAWEINLEGIGWVIAGGESGNNPEYRWDASADWKKMLTQEQVGRRTMEITWAADLRYKAEVAGIPFWFKQVTAAHSGTGEEALGEIVREVPPPPYGDW